MTGPSPRGSAAGPRSIALIGPYGSGKSTLFDALMAVAGSPVRRPGDVRARGRTTELRLGHCTFLGDRWSILDCPGSVEFAFETIGALMAVDLAVVVCEPSGDRVSRSAVVDEIARKLRDSASYLRQQDRHLRRIRPRHPRSAAAAFKIAASGATDSYPRRRRRRWLRRCGERARLTATARRKAPSGSSCRQICANPNRRR